MLTIPPHTSHKLQALDRTVSGPLQTYYNSIAYNWMNTNPGKSIQIYHVAWLLGESNQVSLGTSYVSLEAAIKCLNRSRDLILMPIFVKLFLP